MTLASFFTFDSGQTAATSDDAPQDNSAQAFLQSVFTQVIQNCTSSLDCHVTLLEFLMNTLKLASMQSGSTSFAPLAGFCIQNKQELTNVQAYLPEELTSPLAAVQFRYWTRSSTPPVPIDGTTVNNAYQYLLYAPADQTNFNTAWSTQACNHYTNCYNELLSTYLASADKPQPLSAPITTTALQTQLDSFAAWINANDPRITALTTQITALTTQKTNFGTIITAIFADAHIDTLAFCEAFLGKYKAAANPSPAFNTILKFVCTNLLTLVWLTDAQKSSITSSDYSKLNSPCAKKILSAALDIIRIGLKDSANAATTKTAVCTALQNVDGTVLSKALDTLITNVNTDPATLMEWKEKAAAPPTTLPKDVLHRLIEIAGDILSSIPLMATVNASDNDPITAVRLFAFSDYDALNDYYALNLKNLTDLAVDTVTVEKDLQESSGTTCTFTSRPVFWVTADNSGNPVLKFFNVGGATPTANAFYFLDRAEPSQVLTHVAGRATPLSFDFRTATIDESTCVTANVQALLSTLLSSKYPEDTAYRTTSGGVSDSTVFYDVLKDITQWKFLNGRISYDVLYQTVSGSSMPAAHLIWRLPTGRSLSRADKIHPSLCLWEWLAPSETQKEFPQLAGLLKLPPERKVIPNSDGSSFFQMGKKTWSVIQEDTRSFGGFQYQFLTIAQAPNGPSETYVLTNTPAPSLPARLDMALARNAPTATKLGDDPDKILSIFDFAYYRKVDMSDPAAPKVIKWIANKGNPQRPVVGDGVALTDSPDGYSAVGIGLPISFRLQPNLVHFKNYTSMNGQFGPALKNKGNVLYRTRGVRKDAGGVMKGLLSSLGSPQELSKGSTLPATRFANWLLSKQPPIAPGNNLPPPTPSVLPAWRQLKNSNRSSLPVNQEWCHLQGHGDGGGERLGNFVSGSYHCNTEQLAIETGQRQTTHTQKGGFQLRTTAYLFRNNPQIISANYLDDDSTYRAVPTTHPTRKTATPRQTDTGMTAPFAAFIRYKVYRQAPNNSVEKYFDHIFEGQSEFIDEYQFSILSATVKFALAGMDALKFALAGMDVLKAAAKDAPSTKKARPEKQS